MISQRGKVMRSLVAYHSKALIVVDFDENSHATERYRYDMGERIRSVLNVDGQVWVLEDGDNSGLLQLIPQ